MYKKEQLLKILEFREKKAAELKRPVSVSEAIALWLSESFKPVLPVSRKRKIAKHQDVYIY